MKTLTIVTPMLNSMRTLEMYLDAIWEQDYPHNIKVGNGKIVLFALCCITIIPLIVQMLIGYARRGDIAARKYHFPICWMTLWIYGIGTIQGIFKKEAADRSEWKQ